MQATSLPELRPLNLGQLLDRAFRLYRHHFLVFIGIIAITQLPVALIQIGFSSFTAVQTSDFMTAPQSPEEFSQFGQVVGTAVGVGILLTLIGVVFSMIGTAALTRAVADIYLGKSATIIGSFRKIGRSWLTLLGALILLGLISFAAMIPLFLVALIPCLGAVIAIAGIIAIILALSATTTLATPVVVLEKMRATAAIQRAWRLFRLRPWWIIGYILLISLMAYLVILGPTLIAAGIFTVVAPTANPFTSTAVQQSVTYLFSIIFMPIQLTALTLMYFDLRIRFEGFDLMLLAAADDISEKDPDAYPDEA